MTEAPKMPGTVMAAAILWIIYGGLGLLGGLTTLAAGGASYFQLIFAAAFLITGIQVLMGKASSILASGIVCIVLGGVFLLVAGLLLSAIRFLPGWVIMIVFFNSGILILAGILAVVGNAGFKEWRNAKLHSTMAAYGGYAPAPGPQAGYPPQPQAAPPCQTCQAPLRWVAEQNRWWCDRCGR